ncbi:MAG: spore protease YyaC [Christensenellales bacterium]|jgi:putative sporulation protein YyaC
MIPVILCIGSESVMGDSLGPSVGTLLKESYNLPVFVYGSEGSPVHAKNLKETLEFIETVHEGSVVIAVDACLGAEEDKGKIKIRRGGVKAGRAVKKNLGAAGDIGVLGVVEEYTESALDRLLTVSALNLDKLIDKVAYLVKAAV